MAFLLLKEEMLHVLLMAAEDGLHFVSVDSETRDRTAGGVKVGSLVEIVQQLLPILRRRQTRKEVERQQRLRQMWRPFRILQKVEDMRHFIDPHATTNDYIAYRLKLFGTFSLPTFLLNSLIHHLNDAYTPLKPFFSTLRIGFKYRIFEIIFYRRLQKFHVLRKIFLGGVLGVGDLHAFEIGGIFAIFQIWQ